MVGGNPKVLDKRLVRKICNRIKKGNYVKQSVISCGVNYNTFQSSMRKGKKGIAPYDEFWEMIEQAKAEAEIIMSERITESAENGNVGADMWKMQRMFPQRWGQTKRVEAKVDNSQEITIRKYSEITDKEE